MIMAPDGSARIVAGSIVQANQPIFHPVERRVVWQHGLTAKQVENHVQSGFLKRYMGADEAQIITPEQLTDRVPGVEVPQALKGKGRGEEEAIDHREALTTKAGLREDERVMQAPVSGPRVAPPSPYTYNPEELHERDLDSLNLLSQELGILEPFTTKEEAVAVLSKDYAPAQD